MTKKKWTIDVSKNVTDEPELKEIELDEGLEPVTVAGRVGVIEENSPAEARRQLVNELYAEEYGGCSARVMDETTRIDKK